jgi:hypothetical protein
MSFEKLLGIWPTTFTVYAADIHLQLGAETRSWITLRHSHIDLHWLTIIGVFRSNVTHLLALRYASVGI